MSDVRQSDGPPTIVAFGGVATPSACPPIVVDKTTGALYSIKSGDLVIVNGGWGLASALTGILQGKNGSIQVITDSSTVGQVLRVSGSAVYGWGAVNLADSDAITGLLPLVNLTPGSSGQILTTVSGLAAWAAADAGIAKVFGSCDANAATLGTPKNISSFTDTSSALKAVAFSVNFTSADYTAICSITQSSNSAVNDNYKVIAQTSGGCSIINQAETNVTHISLACFGVLA